MRWYEPTQTTDELGNIRNFSSDTNFWPKSATDTIDGQTATAVSFTFNLNGTVVREHPKPVPRSPATTKITVEMAVVTHTATSMVTESKISHCC